MDETPPPTISTRRKRRWRKRRIALGCLTIPTMILLGAGGWLWWRLSLKPNPTVDYIALLNEHARSVPEEDRAWPLMQQLIAELEEQDEPYRLVRHRPPGDPTPEELADYEAGLDFVRRRPDVIERLWVITEKPALGAMYVAAQPEPETAIDPQNPSMGHVGSLNMYMVHLQRIRPLARLLTTDARLAFDKGDIDRFIQNCQSALTLADYLLDDKALVIHQLIRLSIEAIVCDAVIYAFGNERNSLNAEQLAALRTPLQRHAVQPNRTPSLEGERLVLEDVLQHVYSDGSRGDGALTVDGLRYVAFLSAEQRYTPWEARLNMLAHLDASTRSEVRTAFDSLYRLAEDEAQRPFHVRALAYNEYQILMAAKSLGDGDAGNMLVRHHVPAVGRLLTAQAMLDRELAQTLAILALKQHHLEHGSYPDSLNALVPEYLDELPADMFDGNPLRYRLEPDGSFRLWSIGNDRDDDGGIRHPRAHEPVTLRTDGTQLTPEDFADAEPGEYPIVVDGDHVIWPPQDD